MQPIHSTHNGPPVWMNATVLFTTWHPFREGEKRTKKWKMPSVPQWPSQHQSARSPSSPGLFFTLCRCVYFAMSLSPSTLLLCLLTSGVKYQAGFHIPLRLTHSQLLFVFVALVRESGCGRNTAMLEQPLTNPWNMGLNWQWKGIHGMYALNQLLGKPLTLWWTFMWCCSLCLKPSTLRFRVHKVGLGAAAEKTGCYIVWYC